MPRHALFVLTLASLATAQAKGPQALMPEQHRAFFDTYCLDCHNADKQKGKVRLDDLPFDLDNIPTAERWQKILNTLNSGEMPPEDEKQPPEAEKTIFLDHLSNTMVTARKKLTDQGGVITMRRLNRREYDNTIQDLLGVRVNVKTLPSDAGSGGFDTAGKALFFSSDQFEQYLAIARTALDEAMAAGERPETRRVHRECEETATPSLEKALAKMLVTQKDGKQAIAENEPKQYGFPDLARAKFQMQQAELRIPIHEQVLNHPLTKSGALLTLSTGYARDVTTIPDDAPAGDYLLRVRLGGLPGVPGHRHFIEIGQGGDENNAAKGEMIVLGCYQVTGTPGQPQTIEIPITVTKAGSRTFILRERQHNDRKAVQLAFLRAFEQNGVGPEFSLWLDSVEWEGPLIKEWPPEPHQKLIGSSTAQNDSDARDIVSRFATRAFRGKPTEPAFLDKLMARYTQRRKAGDSFETALKDPLALILASPSFLYLVEKSETPSTRRTLTDLELANRLSYFLWSAPPDDELMSLAQANQLNDPETLARQVDRLIDHPKVWGFLTGFLSQWLKMERLDFFKFNASLYPAFDHSAKLAARDEVFHTFQTVLRENLGTGQLLKPDFVVINDLLADYYSIPSVEGSHFRKVPVPADSIRGGMLGMAAILAMGSDGERSSPVERGAFVMRKLLHTPPPPAPANVPQLSRLAGQILSARDLLSAHMEEAQCAQCHRKIDPIGFGLENFNAAGLWRLQESIPTSTNKKQGRGKGKTQTFPIDPSGQLPDGTAFQDYLSLRDVVSQRADAFTRGLTEALIEYCLGRPYGFSDDELADSLLTATKPDNFRFRSLIHALVASQPFHAK